MYFKHFFREKKGDLRPLTIGRGIGYLKYERGVWTESPIADLGYGIFVWNSQYTAQEWAHGFPHLIKDGAMELWQVNVDGFMPMPEFGVAEISDYETVEDLREAFQFHGEEMFLFSLGLPEECLMFRKIVPFRHILTER